MVAVGGPVRVYCGDVGRRLGCEVVFPDHCDVANAVGTATGVVARTVTVRVDGDGSGLFMLHSTVGTKQFTDPAAAIEAATVLARQLACDAVIAMGATDLEVRISLRMQLLPNAVSDAGLLEAVVEAVVVVAVLVLVVVVVVVVVAEAIGWPNAAP